MLSSKTLFSFQNSMTSFSRSTNCIDVSTFLYMLDLLKSVIHKKNPSRFRKTKRDHQNILAYAPVGNAVEKTARTATPGIGFAPRAERGYPAVPCPPPFTCRGSLWSGRTKDLSFLNACIFENIVPRIVPFVKRFCPPPPIFCAARPSRPQRSLSRRRIG